MSAGELLGDLPGGGRALFTTRAHGNLSSVGGEGADGGEQARESLRELIGVRGLARGYQMHGTVVRRVDDESTLGEGVETRDLARSAGVDATAGEADGGLVEADGQATSTAGIGAMVLSADCLPVALGCKGAVAMVHAGWRGLAAGVLEEGVHAVRERGQGEKIVAIVGPCAGACCYEVGSEVHAAFAGAHRHGERIDLRAIAHDRLLAAGVAEVRDVRACTICDERFFSYRREGERAGRQAGVAWLS